MNKADVTESLRNYYWMLPALLSCSSVGLAVHFFNTNECGFGAFFIGLALVGLICAIMTGDKYCK